MRRLVSSFAAFTLVVAMPGMVSAAFAHGGVYRGPAGEVPPGSREPTDPPAPPEGGTPSTPGGEPTGGPPTGGPDAGNGPVSGAGGSGAAGTGGAGGGPKVGGGGGGSVGTGAGRAKGAGKGVGYSSWVFWWGYNKDEILRVKGAVNRMHRSTTTGDDFGHRSKNAIRTVTDTAITEQIVPALRALLADESQSFHIRSAAELGLAKIGDEGSVETLRRMAQNEANTLHREIEETAALALGLMQRDEATTREFLVRIVREQARDGTFARPFSAISLGLLGDRNDRERLAMAAMIEVIARKEPGADIKASCLTALGLAGNDAAIPDLVAMLRTGKAALPGAVGLTQVETAYVVGALGRIGRPGTEKAGDETCVLDEIVKLTGKDKAKSPAGLNVRRSAAIALGQVAPQCTAKLQRRVVEVLKQIAAPNSEEQERNFAIMALGRIGAAKTAEPDLRKDLIALLAGAMDDGQGQTPPFAAMALGLIGREIGDEGGAAPEEEIRKPLRAKFAKKGVDAHTRGAFALASGLVRDPLATERLIEALKDRTEDKRVRGWAALSLGMIGDRCALEVIRTTLKDEADHDLRVEAAMAAGLLGDASVIGDLVGVLHSHDSSNYEIGSAALALGQIGEERAIGALLEIAMDKSNRYPDLTRSLTVVALGQIGDRRDVPTLARLSTDVNYRAHVPAITELLSIL